MIGPPIPSRLDWRTTQALLGTKGTLPVGRSLAQDVPAANKNDQFDSTDTTTVAKRSPVGDSVANADVLRRKLVAEWRALSKEHGVVSWLKTAKMIETFTPADQNSVLDAMLELIMRDGRAFSPGARTAILRKVGIEATQSATPLSSLGWKFPALRPNALLARVVAAIKNFATDPRALDGLAVTIKAAIVASEYPIEMRAYLAGALTQLENIVGSAGGSKGVGLATIAEIRSDTGLTEPGETHTQEIPEGRPPFGAGGLDWNPREIRSTDMKGIEHVKAFHCDFVQFFNDELYKGIFTYEDAKAFVDHFDTERSVTRTVRDRLFRKKEVTDRLPFHQTELEQFRWALVRVPASLFEPSALEHLQQWIQSKKNDAYDHRVLKEPIKPKLAADSKISDVLYKLAEARQQSEPWVARLAPVTQQGTKPTSAKAIPESEFDYTSKTDVARRIQEIVESQGAPVEKLQALTAIAIAADAALLGQLNDSSRFAAIETMRTLGPLTNGDGAEHALRDILLARGNAISIRSASTGRDAERFNLPAHEYRLRTEHAAEAEAIREQLAPLLGTLELIWHAMASELASIPPADRPSDSSEILRRAATTLVIKRAATTLVTIRNATGIPLVHRWVIPNLKHSERLEAPTKNDQAPEPWIEEQSFVPPPPKFLRSTTPQL